VTEPELPIVPADDPRLIGFRQALAVMDRLRGEGGCPWDRVQTHASLRPFLLEETFELLEQLDLGDSDKVREELGDVLFQVLFHARLAQEEGRWDVGDVGHVLSSKLVRRHPHVFAPRAEDAGKTAEAIVTEWDAHKRREGRRSALDGVPRALPALLRAQRVQEKAARVGFDWSDPKGPLDKLDEELREVRERLDRGDREGVAQEMGDLAFAYVNLARHLQVPAEDALRAATEKFERRFRRVEELAGGDLKARGLTLSEMDALWDQAKAEELRA
jgi:tetrapyrrole methylase family protein/MazG family protein